MENDLCIHTEVKGATFFVRLFRFSKCGRDRQSQQSSITNSSKRSNDDYVCSSVKLNEALGKTTDLQSVRMTILSNETVVLSM